MIRLFSFIIFGVLLSNHLAFCIPDHEYFFGRDGEMWSMEENGVIFKKEGRFATLLGRNQSPSGLYMYLERLNLGMGNPRFGAASSERAAKYRPDRIMLKLHICDKEGNDIKVVPISELYCSAYTHGQFYGENYIGLQAHGRYEGKYHETLINLETGKIIYAWENHRGDLAAYPSPDGKRLACVVWGEGNECALLLDGIQVYPFYEENAPDISMMPDEYKSQKAKQEKWFRENPGNYDLQYGKNSWSEGNPSPWSPDGRYLAFFQPRPIPKDQRNEDNIQIINYVEGANKAALDLLVFDTEKLGPGQRPADYMRRTKTTISSLALLGMPVDPNLLPRPSSPQLYHPPVYIEWPQEQTQQGAPSQVNANELKINAGFTTSTLAHPKIQFNQRED